MLQEETIRRLEREKKVLNDKLMTLETSVAQVEADKRALREKVAKSQKNETRGEKEREAMRTQIDNAESRVTRMDLKRKSLESMCSPPGKIAKNFILEEWVFAQLALKMQCQIVKITLRIHLYFWLMYCSRVHVHLYK